MAINREWHEQNKMPAGANAGQRLAWHEEHQKHCGCRPIPKSLLKSDQPGSMGLASKMRLIDAVQQMDVEAVKRILDARPELINVTDRRDFNMLHLACAASHSKLDLPYEIAIRMANLLLDRGMEIDAAEPKDGCTALFFAVNRARNLA